MMSAGVNELQNRTLICSVLFIDIVDYSQRSVSEQNNLKNRFNSLLSEALRGVAVNDRIILDTGDGAAISFIGDPEDALFVATGLRDVIVNEPEPIGSQLATRMGINLGPVRLVKDINGRPNIIGDGINVAQRVMTFSEPGQVLVSRSYYEVVSRLSDESSRLFSYEGARTDKHVREHEVYAVGAIAVARRRVEEQQQGADWQAQGNHATPPALARASQSVKKVADRVVNKPRVATLLAVVGILAIALGARAYRDAEEEPAGPQEVAAATPAPAPEPPPPVKREEPPGTEVFIKGLPPPPVEPQVAPTPDAKGKRERTPVVDARQKTPVLEGKPREQVAAAAPNGDPAVVSFAISPWGEVYVDGKMHGVSPPLQELTLSPGRHKIELRNSGLPSHVVTVNAKSGERLRIKHKFN